ncbi:MAG: RluA family pseudouridine synthase [Deltaproteobacteria bacterium]|nr:RluA family pseudouridine synthase [Deltaproteobacteria bacterium]
MEKFTREITVGPDDPTTACELLARHTGLAKGRIKDAMTKGAVWLKKRENKLHRLRRATAVMRPGNLLTIYYDAALLALVPPQPRCISNQGRYSVWHKPAGLMAQGTKYGDHCSLLRQAELFFRPQRQVFLVHRLDREAAGIMLIAHSREAAKQLSLLFQNNLIAKHYRAEVLGNLLTRRETRIDLPLDGKAALTEFAALSYDPATNTSKVMVQIKTGRLHQIRRHFDLIGHPVMGDPRYGMGNKNKKGLQLVADQLRFTCPFAKREVVFTTEDGAA